MNSEKLDSSFPPVVWMYKKNVSSAVQSVAKLPDVLQLRLKFGLYCQVPFPNPKMAKKEQWTADTAIDLLQNDAVAFQCKDSVTNFLNFCVDVLHLEVDINNPIIKYKNRKIKICIIPVALPFDRYGALMKAFSMELTIPPFESSWIVMVDPLTRKCALRIIERFAEFNHMIQIEPEIRGLVTFLQVVLVTEDNTIRELQDIIDYFVAKINKKFVRSKWTPIVVAYGNPDMPVLKPFYAELEYMSNFGLEEKSIEKEFLLQEVKVENQTLLLFSPFSGTTHQMTEASIRKGKEHDITATLLKNMMMPQKERMNLLKKLRSQPVPFIKEYLMKLLLIATDNVVVNGMDEMKPKTTEFFDENLSTLVAGSKPITLILDLECALTPLPHGKEDESISEEIAKVLQNLSHHPRIKIILVSGRDPAEVFDMVGAKDVMYIGNNGFSVIYPDGSRWDYPINKDYNKIIKLMDELYSEACVNGAHVTNHGALLVYHFRHILPVYRKPQYIKAWKIATFHGFKVNNWMRKLTISLPTDNDKGQMCQKALEYWVGNRWTEETHVFYIGGSLSDEIAMRELSKETAITGFRVTNGHFPKTVADILLPSYESVIALLHWIDVNVPMQQAYTPAMFF